MKKSKVVILAAGLAWLSVVALGMKILWDYARMPGQAATAPVSWPADTGIQLDSSRATLVMFIHPHCPCSRASIRELELLMARCSGRVTTRVVVYKPTQFADDWAMTDLWESAADIPDVDVQADEDGIEARRFNAATSGQALLYSAEGQLLFSGGITASRGHSGDNAGRSAIVSLLTQRGADRTETPVYGCPIFAEGSKCEQGVQECVK